MVSNQNLGKKIKKAFFFLFRPSLHLKMTLCKEKRCLIQLCRISANIGLRKTCITKINQDVTENPAFKNKTLQADPGEQFFHEKFPAHLKFSVISVDCQHTLWNVPAANNGREYIQFLDKKIIKNYLRYPDAVYWDCNLGDTIKKYVPKLATQEKRDITKKEQMNCLQS